jgi:hypothetical protein
MELSLGFVIVGILASLLGGSIMPLLLMAVVIWAAAHFFAGFLVHVSHFLRVNFGPK